MQGAIHTPGDDAPIPGGKLSKFELYSSKQRFYIVGQHAPEDRFYIIKIDRFVEGFFLLPENLIF